MFLRALRLPHELILHDNLAACRAPYVGTGMNSLAIRINVVSAQEQHERYEPLHDDAIGVSGFVDQ